MEPTPQQPRWELTSTIPDNLPNDSTPIDVVFDGFNHCDVWVLSSDGTVYKTDLSFQQLVKVN